MPLKVSSMYVYLSVCTYVLEQIVQICELKSKLSVFPWSDLHFCSFHGICPTVLSVIPHHTFIMCGTVALVE